MPVWLHCTVVPTYESFQCSVRVGDFYSVFCCRRVRLPVARPLVQRGKPVRRRMLERTRVFCLAVSTRDESLPLAHNGPGCRTVRAMITIKALMEKAASHVPALACEISCVNPGHS